ncbi:zinc finger protein 512B isoform X2 [Oncorhynchus mykiss]|uniref:zinc finger protein 512B isoform X2 n=1 Tax=Oncorhynchus mykiss TaxID=8022 RepID=UPI00187889A7|nr:zinc finger protein 512B isoform X2 [Oncorhynchus mykiss]
MTKYGVRGGEGRDTSLLECLMKDKKVHKKKQEKNVFSQNFWKGYKKEIECEDEVPAVSTNEFKPCPGDDQDDSGPVGVRFVERMDPCILTDPYVVSGWLEKRLGTGTPCSERGEGKKKVRPEEQELRSIPANMMVQWKEEFKKRSRVTCPGSGCWLEFPSIYGLKYHYQRCQGVTLAERLSHGCPDCKAVFATKVSLQKHKLWNHPIETKAEPKLHKTPVKGTARKRPMENTPLSPVFFKVKKTQEVSSPSQNGECAPKRGKRKQHPHPQPPQQQADTSPNTSGGSESEDEGSSLLPPYPNEDHERTRHRRKQKTPKKFTGEQPSISGTFGLKGMNKVEEKLKAGRVKRLEGGLFSEELQRKHPGPASRRDLPPLTSAEAQWQHAISERGEVVCPTCSIVTRKTISGLKKHMEICRKLQDALKCQQCQKQFRSKAGLNYHTMAEHSSKALGSEDQMGDVQLEREGLRRVLKQTGRIKCPKESCSAHFFSLMGYQYHQKRCGRELSEEDKPVFLCQHCGKTYRSKTGRDYHLCTEHPTTNNNTSGRGMRTEEGQPAGRREQNHMEREKDGRERERERKDNEKGQELSAGREKDGRERERERKDNEKGQELSAGREKDGRDRERERKDNEKGQELSVGREKDGRDRERERKDNEKGQELSAGREKDGRERERDRKDNEKGQELSAGREKDGRDRKDNEKGQELSVGREKDGRDRKDNEKGQELSAGREKDGRDRKDNGKGQELSAGREKDGREMERERKDKEKGQELSVGREKDGREREREGLGEDFERTPSGRVRRRSAQVAVFHLQEIAEDELDKDWGTKRDDLVPDSKRLNYTRPGLPIFSPKLLESWRNEVKEKGFICCSNGSCEAVYSSVSGLKAHLANCNQAEGDAGKYTCLLCQKEFSSESGVKYHISKTHSQNWFRAFSHMLPSSSSSISSRSKPPDFQGKMEVKNRATMGKKRGRKPKERPPEATPVQTNTFFSTTQNSAPTLNRGQTPVPTETGNPGSMTLNRQPNQPTTRRSRPKWVPPPSE